MHSRDRPSCALNWARAAWASFGCSRSVLSATSAGIPLRIRCAGLFFQIIHARDRFIEAMRDQRREQIRNLQLEIVFLRRLIRPGDQVEAGRCGRGLPQSFHGRQLGRLVRAVDEAERIAQADHRDTGEDAEQGRHSERTLGQLHMALAQHVERADAEHERCCREIARDAGVHKLGLGIGVEHQIAEAGQLHAHGGGVERGAHRRLHVTVGDQNPQRRQIRAERDHIGHQQVLAPRELAPAKQHQADHGRFEEERHQAFDGQRRPEDIAHVVRVGRPVGAELELHGQPGSHAEREVDREQLAPEVRHLTVDRSAGDNIHRLDGRQQHAQPERERHEYEVVEHGGRELPA